MRTNLKIYCLLLQRATNIKKTWETVNKYLIPVYYTYKIYYLTKFFMSRKHQQKKGPQQVDPGSCLVIHLYL